MGVFLSNITTVIGWHVLLFYFMSFCSLSLLIFHIQLNASLIITLAHCWVGVGWGVTNENCYLTFNFACACYFYVMTFWCWMNTIIKEFSTFPFPCFTVWWMCPIQTIKNTSLVCPAFTQTSNLSLNLTEILIYRTWYFDINLKNYNN